MALFSKSNGINFNDPHEFQRSIIKAGSLQLIAESSGTPIVATGTSFFTQCAARGLADNTSWTADTYKTLLSVSAGSIVLVSCIGGPTGLAGTPTTTFEITMDGGSPQTIAVAATTTGQRAVLGALMVGDGSNIIQFTVADYPTASPVALSADKTTLQLGTTVKSGVPGWNHIRNIGTPCLMARNGIIIRAKSSENNSTTTNAEQQSFIQYMVLS